MKTSAPPENLFKVDDDCKKLNLKKATAFHNIIVAKALYITKPRPDIFKMSHLASHEVLPLRYKRITIDSWWRQHRYCEMVCKCIICCASKHERAYWRCHMWLLTSRKWTRGVLRKGNGWYWWLDAGLLWTQHISWKHRDTMWRRTSCNKSSILLARNGKASSSKHTKHLPSGISLLLIIFWRVV